MERIFRAFAALVFLFAVFPIAGMQLGSAQSSSCSELLKQRNSAFDTNKTLLKEIATARAAIQVEENKVDLLSGTAQDAARDALARRRKGLRSLIQVQQEKAAKLKQLDDAVARCKSGQGQTIGGDWAGTWRSGYTTYKIVSVGNQQLRWTSSGSPSPENSTEGKGRCTISGNEAKCDFELTGKGPSFQSYISGVQTLTLSGDTIHDSSTIESVSCSPESNPWCQVAHSARGKTLEKTWERVH